MSSRNVEVESFGFSMYTIMSSTKGESLNFFFASLNAFYLFLLSAEARTSSTMLNNSGERGHPCHVPDLRGKAPRVSPLRMIFAVGF